MCHRGWGWGWLTCLSTGRKRGQKRQSASTSEGVGRTADEEWVSHKVLDITEMTRRCGKHIPKPCEKTTKKTCMNNTILHIV